MIFKLEVSLENDAFTERGADAVAEILRVVALRLLREGFPRGQANIRDVNGNGVGFYTIRSPRR